MVAAAARLLTRDRDEVHLLTVVDESEVEETHTGTPVSAPLPQATGAGLTLPIDQPVAPTVRGS